jgi:thiosulfate dehydrogenase [quinone] large subunit
LSALAAMAGRLPVNVHFVLAKKTARPQPQRAIQAPARWPAYETVPLRLFLAVTFVYAGVQKIADPGFLQPGAPTYIGSQLQGFATHSPIGFLIQIFALPVPQLAGIGVIAAELVIGVLVLIGLGTRWAAAAGALLNFVLFLTASWNVQPYFLGSDGIYTVAWITLVLVGDRGVLTVRPLIFGAAQADTRGRPPTTDLSRRRLMIQLGAGAVGLVWVLGLLPRVRSFQASSSSPTPPASATATPSTSPSAVATPSGTRIGTLADLQAQGSLRFQAPGSGDPAVAVSIAGGSVVAFDAVCTHAGCTVAYDQNLRLLGCPCHGAAFDPANGGAVVAGPAPTPLTAIPLQVAADGFVYAG